MINAIRKKIGVRILAGVIAILIIFASSELEWRNREIRDRGASWDHDGYTPHVTISWKAEGVDLDAVKPYSGRIILGPEIFEPINDDWKATNIEKKDGALRKAHIDQELGLVFGFAVVCKHNGQPYFDRQLGDDGKPFPDHIPEGSMLEASLDFAKNSRAAGDMHESIQEGGSVPFMIPLTSDLRKFIIENDTTGLLIGMAPNAEVLAKFKSGDYSGFSIGGMRIEDTEIEA